MHTPEQDEQGNVVLELFLGALRMTPDKENKSLLHEDHGKLGPNGTPEFERFAKN